MEEDLTQEKRGLIERVEDPIETRDLRAQEEPKAVKGSLMEETDHQSNL
jgi:hypothetical protein